MILLEESWAELFLLNAIQWCLPLEQSALFSVAEHAQAAPNGKAGHVAADIRCLNDCLMRYKAVAVDPAEFACLKAIVLFRSGILPARYHPPFRHQGVPCLHGILHNLQL